MWFQVFLSNTNNLYTDMWLQVFLSNTNILYIYIWFQAFQSNTNNLCNSTLIDTNAVRAAVGDLELWLARGDKSGLLGRFKAWVYQHVVLPKIFCPLFIYDSPMTIVEARGKKINSYLRRWLCLPRCLRSAALYGTSTVLQLPFKGLVEEFVVSRSRRAPRGLFWTSVRSVALEKEQ